MLIADRLGLDFTGSRQADLERGLDKAMETSSASAPEQYLAWLATLPDGNHEWRRLAGYLTVGETYFFRDRACCDALAHHVLPDLITARRSDGTLRLRLWSAACATGEEAYSLAMLVDRLLPDRSDWSVTILATDINMEALAIAQLGLYREWSLRGVSEPIRDRYFHRRGTEFFEIDPVIRQMVSFAPLNLAENSYPTMMTNTTALDLILCRNVLMYFTHEAQRVAVTRLQRALVTGGWLVVSPVEASAELLHPLSPVNFPGAIFYRRESAGHHLSDDPHTLFSLHECSHGIPHRDLSAPLSQTVHQPKIPCSVTFDGENEPAAEEPPNTMIPIEQARALANQGNLDDAQSLCETVLEGNRLDVEAHLLLSAILQEKGALSAALEALRRAIYLVPDSVPAHFLLGSLLLRVGNHKRGRRCMEIVVRLLHSVSREEVVAGSEGLTAGRLMEMANVYLEAGR